MSVQIAAGAGIEAIIFGTFGVQMEEGKLRIKPYNHEDIGEATLKDLRYRGRTFGIELKRKTFSVYERETLLATKFYGDEMVIDYE
jgi:trehalose/maltose hydrolase-like predicted phosphorylase